MRALATALLLLTGPGALLADGRTDLDVLRARCNEQERQIRALENEIESLHSQLALERRRSRGAEPSAAPASPILPTVHAPYTVKGGDTLSSIARRYRTTAARLMKTNGIEDPTRLRVGQKLTLPVEATAPKSPTPAPAQAAPAPVVAEKPQESNSSKPVTTTTKPSRTYTVQRGDTLYGIARKHKVSMSTLRALNPKAGDKIVVGQTLTVSGTPKAVQISTPSHSTTKTQTIATRTSAPAPNTTAKKPQVSPTPKLPVAKKTSEPAPKTSAPASETPPEALKVAESKEPEAAPSPAPRTISSIIVMDEVSLGDLAAKHGTTTDQLNALNNWNYKSNLILARGSEVYVPGS